MCITWECICKKCMQGLGLYFPLNEKLNSFMSVTLNKDRISLWIESDTNPHFDNFGSFERRYFDGYFPCLLNTRGPFYFCNGRNYCFYYFWSYGSIKRMEGYGNIALVPKKGSLKRCYNWRGIALLCL